MIYIMDKDGDLCQFLVGGALSRFFSKGKFSLVIQMQNKQIG
jgi:hypothetical protein